MGPRAATVAMTLVLVLSAAASGLVGTAAAETVSVTGGGDALQSAIDDAEAGDTIVVEDSAVYEPIVVSKTLTIRAAEGESPVIDGRLPVLGAGPAVEIGGTGVVLRGFTIVEGPEAAVDVSTQYSLGAAEDAHVVDNRITRESAETELVWIGGSENTFENNTFVGQGSGMFGRSVGGTTDFHFVDNTVKSFQTGLSFQLSGSSGLVVRGNLFQDVGGAGVGFLTRDGVEASNLTVTGNHFHDTERGVYFGEHNGEITGPVTVTGNSFTDIGSELSDSLALVLAGSPETSEQAMMDDPDETITASVDATDNWYGDSSGPGGLGPGDGFPIDDAGETAGETITFDPWLESAPDDVPAAVDEDFAVEIPDTDDDAEETTVAETATPTGTATPTETVADETGTPTAEPTTTGGETATPGESGDGVPGFGVGVALIALLAGALLAVRGRDS